MTAPIKRHRKPAITIGEANHAALTRLAETHSETNPTVADVLLAELDRAKVVPDEKLRDDVVRMGSTLRYTTETGEARTVTLVYPAQADIEAGKISILTPIGAALIGLSAGQSIEWEARDGRIHILTIETVQPVND